MGYAILNSEPTALMSFFHQEIIPILIDMVLLKKTVFKPFAEGG